MSRQTKYSVGDKLIACTKDRPRHTPSGLFVTTDMREMDKQEATITRAYINATGDDRYGVSFHGERSNYSWSNSCFEEPDTYTQEIEL